VILTAGLDLSVGSTVALVSVVSGFGMRELGIAGGAVAGLLTGIAVGVVNGLVVTRLRVVPFIATLAMLSIASGLALNLSGGVPVTGLPSAFGDLAYRRLFGIPVPVALAFAMLAVSDVILRYTRRGRQLYAVGGSEEAARLSGIEVERVSRTMTSRQASITRSSRMAVRSSPAGEAGSRATRAIARSCWYVA
jgi:ribose transport system permease protein